MQKSLLLKFREKQPIKENQIDNVDYNLIKGLWENNKGEALILNCMNDNLSTTKTSTREGIDQSETSNIDSTLLTKTRESVDQSEVSCLGGTTITESGESVDQSDISTNQTSVTFTRESIDQCENSM